ncbi:MFS transporter [Xanthobacter autotrophicus]|uniref:MFS transporter n=1 Tax=Xanthobacter autotrophicus TaxID=280 RepID=UPI003726FE3C
MAQQASESAPAGAVDLVALLDRAPIGAFHIRVLALCVVIAMLDGFDTQAIAFVAPLLSAQWNLPMSQFSSAFAVGLLGLTVGALVLGPLADRFGRKRILLACTTLFGLFALLTAWSTTFQGLLWLRFLTGVGLGGAMPNIIAMTSEYAPQRLRATAVTVMFCGFPLGSMLGGFLAAKIIPVWGREAVFIVGGVLPLLCVPFLALKLPESARFLVSHDKDAAGVGAIVRQLSPEGARLGAATRYYLPEEQISGFTVRHLFSQNRTASTLLLWIAFFCNLLVMYFLVNWLPALLKQSGYPLDAAIYATSTLNLGGVVGGVAVGRLIDRMGPFAILGTAYAMAAVFIGVMANAGGSGWLLYGALFIVGIGVVGAQIGMNAVASSLYPTGLRSTGIGWALGVGRLGSILGPTVGGFLLAQSWAPEAIIQVSLWPAAVAALAVFTLGWVVRARPSTAAAPA